MSIGIARVRGSAALAAAQLWHHRRRVLLAVAGVAVAVLLITLLTGLGHGVTTRGMSALENTNRDLWMSADVEFAPASVGGVDNGLLDAHQIARQVEEIPGVRRAQAVSFQTVYAGSTTDEFSTVVGMGITGTSAPIPLQEGTEFDRGDVHYAEGSYDGPRTSEVIVDDRAAHMLGVSVNDTIHIGGTIVNARETEFTVVGVSSGISSFVGAPTVILPLSELQELTGTTGSDAASIITITVKDGSSSSTVAADLKRAFPEHSVRTNEEQLNTVLKRQAPVLVSILMIVVVAIVVGLALVINVAALLVYGQRRELAALKAGGVSNRFLLGTAGTQGVTIGLVGGAIGLAATPLATIGLNRVVERLTGIESLIAAKPLFLLVGLGMAVCMGIVGAAIAGWFVGRISPLEHLE